MYIRLDFFQKQCFDTDWFQKQMWKCGCLILARYIKGIFKIIVILHKKLINIEWVYYYFNEFKIYVKIFPVSVSEMANIDRYNPHKQ